MSVDEGVILSFGTHGVAKLVEDLFVSLRLYEIVGLRKSSGPPYKSLDAFRCRSSSFAWICVNPRHA